MAVSEWIRNKLIGNTSNPSKPVFAIYKPNRTEQLKALQPPTEQIRFPQDLGEAHPFDYELTQHTYLTFGFMTGVIDKSTDLIVGPGYRIQSENKKAEKLLNDWNKSVSFPVHLRQWIREGLVKGPAIMELGVSGTAIVKVQVLNPNYIFIKKDKEGKIEWFNQYIRNNNFSNFDFKKDAVQLDPRNILFHPFNKIGDSSYGYGIVYSALPIINNLAKIELDMMTLIRRKANSPIIANIGDEQNQPTQEIVDAIGQEFEYLNNKTEWAFDHTIKLSTLDFGKVGDKFQFVIDYMVDLLFFQSYIPEIMMGRSAATGLGSDVGETQKETSTRRIQSIRAELEMTLINQLYKRILVANGLDAEIDIIWDEPGTQDKYTRLEHLKSLMTMDIDPVFKYEIQREMAFLLGFDADALIPQISPEELRAKAEAEKEKEMNVKQPFLPGSKEKFYNVSERFHKADLEDYTLEKWLGFNYLSYKSSIIRTVEKDPFINLLAENQAQLEAGYLTKTQIKEVRKVFSKGFMEGQSLKEISKELDKEIGFTDLYRMEDDKTLAKSKITKQPVLAMAAENRAQIIARTESTRLAAEGQLLQFKENGISKVRWVASTGYRTCDECSNEDGTVYDISESYGLIPAHVMCRCSFIAVISESKVGKNKLHET